MRVAAAVALHAPIPSACLRHGSTSETVLYTPHLMPDTVTSSETSANYRVTLLYTLHKAVTHLEAYLPRLVVFDSVKHIVGILTGICNTEQKAQ
jgi:hypothetical protein